MDEQHIVQATDTQVAPDAAAEAFLERMGEVINAGALTVMMSIGHRSGLFDVMARLPAAPSDRIAAEAGLAERYVREWLAAMVTGGIIDYDPQKKSYHLPPAHAASLTREAPLGNIAVYAQAIPIMGAIQDQILQCFRTGAGTTYDNYPSFHQFMEEDSSQTVVAQLFESILPLAEGLEARLADGIDVLDAGCGRGRAMIALGERFPASRFVGYDLCADAIADAARAAKERNLANITFETRDLTGFDAPENFDLITSFDAVHDQKDPRGLIESLYRALRPGGIYLMQDIGGSAHLEKNMDFPMASMLYAISCMHCMPVSLGQGGAGLGTMWGWETARDMLKDAGFAAVAHHVFPHDPMNIWFISRK